MSTPVLVLVGPPGAGKTTVGPLVAEALGVSLLDTVSTAGRGADEVAREVLTWLTSR